MTTSSMKSKPGEAAATSAGVALTLGALGSGIGYLVKHPTIGAVVGATLGASVGASLAHLFEDANFFGAMTQPEVDGIKSNTTKVSVSSAIGAAVAGTVGAKVIAKHPTIAAVIAASAGGAVAAALADSALGTPTGEIGTGDWRPVGAFS